MSLIIAADVQDHLILAGDHCAVLSGESNRGVPELVLDSYRKVYPWKYGVVAASGDVFLMVLFCRLFVQHEQTGRPVDLLRVAREAKQARTRSGVPSDRSVGSIFFTLPGREGFELYGVSVRAHSIEYEVIEPISTRFAMHKDAPQASAYEAFNSSLRPSFFYPDAAEFQRHHLDLLAGFFAGQSAVDDRVTASFDACILEKRTGAGLFWQVSEGPKQLLLLEPGAGTDAPWPAADRALPKAACDHRGHSRPADFRDPT